MCHIVEGKVADKQFAYRRFAAKTFRLLASIGQRSLALLRISIDSTHRLADHREEAKVNLLKEYVECFGRLWSAMLYRQLIGAVSFGLVGTANTSHPIEDAKLFAHHFACLLHMFKCEQVVVEAGNGPVDRKDVITNAFAMFEENCQYSKWFNVK